MRNLTLCGVFVILIGLAPNVLAEDLVAVVDLKFLKETDKTAAVLCLGESEDDCGVWATHYLWEARVRQIVSGVEPQARFLVLFGRHALRKEDIRGLVAVMKKLESTSPSEARYQVIEWGMKRELVCFQKAIGSAPLKLKKDAEDSLSCFDAVSPNKDRS